MLPQSPHFMLRVALVASICLCSPFAFAQGNASNRAAPPRLGAAAGVFALRAVRATIQYGAAAASTPKQEDGVVERIALLPHQRVTIALTALPYGDNTKVQAQNDRSLS